MSKMSADQRRRLKELAASMSDEGKRQRTPPRFADDYDRNRPVDNFFQPPPLPSSFRRPDYVPQHSATRSHPAGPAYPPMRKVAMRLVAYVKPLVNICFSYGMCLFIQHYYPQEAPYGRDDRD